MNKTDLVIINFDITLKLIKVSKSVSSTTNALAYPSTFLGSTSL